MNIAKLKCKMVQKGVNADKLAKVLGIDRSTMYRKLKKGTKITIGDAQKIKDALNLDNEEARSIFFG